MKRLLLVFLINLIFVLPSFAINWVKLETPRGKIVEIDSDSAVEYENNFFYNIKFNSDSGDIIVITMQTSISHPFSARIRYYSLDEYEKLNGDYQNITKNMTSSLEPVTYQSTINTCYSYLKKKFNKESNIQIVL